MRGGRATRLHDTPVIPAGCETFFKKDYRPKFEFEHANGLGVVLKAVRFA
jgi:hypothetical protein